MMKKIVLVLVVLSLVFMAAACGSAPAADSAPAERMSGLPDIVRNARRNAPEGVLIGVGSAKLASMSQSKVLAETRARAEIARAMNSMVREMVRDYTASSEVDPDSALAFQENINVTLAEAKIQGAVISDEDFIDGIYYVVIYLSKTDVVKEINQAQAAAKLAIPAMASFNAEARMDAAFDKQSTEEIIIADK